jgi:hypothetical protein
MADGYSAIGLPLYVPQTLNWRNYASRMRRMPGSAAILY